MDRATGALTWWKTVSWPSPIKYTYMYIVSQWSHGVLHIERGFARPHLLMKLAHISHIRHPLIRRDHWSGHHTVKSAAHWPGRITDPDATLIRTPTLCISLIQTITGQDTLSPLLPQCPDSKDFTPHVHEHNVWYIHCTSEHQRNTYVSITSALYKCVCMYTYSSKLRVT